MIKKKKYFDNNEMRNEKEKRNSPEIENIFTLQHAIGNQAVQRLFDGNSIQRAENNDIVIDNVGLIIKVEKQVENQASKKGVDSGTSAINDIYNKIINHCKMNDITYNTLKGDLNNEANIVIIGKIQTGYRVFFWKDPFKCAQAFNKNGETRRVMALQLWGLHEQDQKDQDPIFKNVTLNPDIFKKYGISQKL